jgi:long-chain acyl-CoA synthetase
MQIYVYGDSFKNYLVGVIVPDPETLLPWAKQAGLGNENLASLCKNARVKQLIYNDLSSIAAGAKLPHFMYIKNFHLESEAWTVDNGLLTPSMKLKRPTLKTHYNDAIEKLYQEPTMDAKTHHAKL